MTVRDNGILMEQAALLAGFAETKSTTNFLTRIPIVGQSITKSQSKKTHHW